MAGTNSQENVAIALAPAAVDANLAVDSNAVVDFKTPVALNPAAVDFKSSVTLNPAAVAFNPAAIALNPAAVDFNSISETKPAVEMAPKPDLHPHIHPSNIAFGRHPLLSNPVNPNRPSADLRFSTATSATADASDNPIDDLLATNRKPHNFRTIKQAINEHCNKLDVGEAAKKAKEGVQNVMKGAKKAKDQVEQKFLVLTASVNRSSQKIPGVLGSGSEGQQTGGKEAGQHQFLRLSEEDKGEAVVKQHGPGSKLAEEDKGEASEMKGGSDLELARPSLKKWSSSKLHRDSAANFGASESLK